MDIFTPLQIKHVLFKNCIVMAPMVRFGFPTKDGEMQDKLILEYTKRADKEIGLLISQVISVSPTDNLSKNVTTSGYAGAYSEQHIPYLRKIAESCHKNGSRFFAQLGLAGYAYGDIHSKDINKLTTNELALICNQFINAARICKKAGLDGIELHGAHTFFLNMVSSSYSNRRKDRYGGDLTDRLTLVKEIIDGIKEFSANNFLISYRMGWCDSFSEDIETAIALEQIGIDILHVSHGIPANRKINTPPDYQYSDIVYTGCYLKKYVSIPVITVGEIKNLERGNALIIQGACDFVAYGRPFLADESFVTHSIGNMSYKSCFECHKCKWFTNGENCPAQLLALSPISENILLKKSHKKL